LFLKTQIVIETKRDETEADIKETKVKKIVLMLDKMKTKPNVCVEKHLL